MSISNISSPFPTLTATPTSLTTFNTITELLTSTLTNFTTASSTSISTSTTGQSNNPTSSLLPGSIESSAKQNQSGLTTQLIICGSVGLLCFLVFCYLRTRWPVIFAPRNSMKRQKPPELPNTFFGWILPLIKISKTEMLDKVGLDAVIMLDFILMALKIFSCCSFFGVVVLIPISTTVGNFTDPLVTSVDRLSITVIDESSSYLVAYLIFTYFFTFIAWFFLQQNYDSYIYMRARYLLQLSRSLVCRSIIVTGLPDELRTDQALADYFESLGVGLVVSCHVVRHVKGLGHILRLRANNLDKLESSYVEYLGNPCQYINDHPDYISHHARCITQEDNERQQQQQQQQQLNGFLGLCGPKVDAIDYYTKEFDKWDKLALEARGSPNFDMTSVGFVTFEKMKSALIASQIAINPVPFRCRTASAYEPRDVLWKNIHISGKQRVIRDIIVWGATITLVIFWTVPISFISSFTSIDAIIKVAPGLGAIVDQHPLIQNILQGLIPTILVNIFMQILPLILDCTHLFFFFLFLLIDLGILQGLRARSAVTESTLSKYFFFLIFNVLLVFTIVSTAINTLVILVDRPTTIANILATRLPKVSPFFINYTILQGLLLMPLNLLQPGSLIVSGFFIYFYAKTPRQHAYARSPGSFNYGAGYPSPLLIFIIVLEYSTISPIILVFGALYFGITYIVYKYQFLYVYFRPYEAAGQLWTMVFPRLIVGMILFQLTMLGLFILKNSFVLGALCVPLTVFTIIFKFTIDAAYSRNSLHLPMQLLREEEQLHQPTSYEPLQAADYSTIPTTATNVIPSTEKSADNNHNQWTSAPRQRRLILDEDNYQATPVRMTDYRQPPMFLNPGVLDTGLRQYGNPYLVGELPQLWLPTKLPFNDQQMQSPSIQLSTTSLNENEDHDTRNQRISPTVMEVTQQTHQDNILDLDQVCVHDCNQQRQTDPPRTYLSLFGRMFSNSYRFGSLVSHDFWTHHNNSSNENNNDDDDDDDDSDSHDNRTNPVHQLYYHHPERRYLS
ncbi:uncharacterized protein BX664DRAFT_293215 [Halteromyces radiatus]|uniref:uncharacterized protein n=1 Tax=Halteromyces radiatus TaxID=101107 RepID=UPI002220F60E|nr:uncharacterized protein BX664DRAFT_293215 [Halteromyces radiatus]KAI8097594.1 hypothetical protein BX664DRAFT_293215 [Halteromyces radiatus]